jgi:transcriptional regulator with XRE-family HTH domain
VRSKRQVKNITGRKIAEARALHRPALTQDALSGKLAKVGIELDRASIAKIETDRRGVLDYELKAIAIALKVTADWLLGAKK